MGQIVPQSKSVEALKAFNNAIVTSRLYPPETPQVANAVERGYKGIQMFLREQGKLSFSFQGSSPSICGVPLDQETLDSFPNLIVFRQLRMMGLPKLQIGAEMDRFAFGQLLAVFIATPEKIKNGGGGLPFITGLGLADYFPEVDEEGRSEEADEISDEEESQARRTVKVRPELVAGLCGLETRTPVEDELAERMKRPETATELLMASIAFILADIQKKKSIFASPLFSLMLRKAQESIGENDRNEVAAQLARVLAENLREPAICVLMAQEYPEGFGALCYDRLVASLKPEALGSVFAILREQSTRAQSGDSSGPRVEFFGKVLDRLANTGRGRQFLSAEKARAIINEGEKARRQKRLEAGVQGLLQGNISLLQSEELVQWLPTAVMQMLSSGENPGILVRSMADFFFSKNEGKREALLRSMVVIGERFAAVDHWDLVDLLIEPLVQAVCRPSASDALIEKIVAFLHIVMQNSWQRGDLDRGDKILNIFFRLRTGQMGDSKAVKAIVGKVQDRGIQRTRFPELLASCLAAPKDEALGYRLALQGPVAIRFLVEALINTDKTADRLRIIDLLTSCRSFLVPIILERLPEHMPWFGKRNLIKLLGEAGGEADAESVLPYLRHEDFRVQREAFLCIYRIAGKRRKELLLAALADSSELIKMEIVAALAGLCDSEVAVQLSLMLNDYEFFSERNRADILIKVLEALGRCGCEEALAGVQEFLQLQAVRTARKKIPEQVFACAEKVLNTLESDLQENRKKHVQATQLRKIAMKQAAKRGKTGKAERIITGTQQEQAVRTLLARGDVAGARDQLLQLIEKTAKSRNFTQADHLREWLIEFDPSAFSQIIQAAEIIDREKAAAINKSHLEIWSGLYDILSTEEFSTLYHSLKHKSFRSDEVIVTQGTLQTSLFFINSGKVKLYFEGQGHERLIRTMGSGEIFGAGAFFDASVWTVSVASVGASEISILKLDKLEEWQEEYPGLAPKLQDFSRKFERMQEFIEQSVGDRREHERHRLSGRVSTMLLDNHERSVGVSSMVELFDISLGGLSYQARVSQKDFARLLLGRKVQVKLPLGEKDGEVVTVMGDILAVKSTYAVENDYSVHVHLDKELDSQQMLAIIAAARKRSRTV